MHLTLWLHQITRVDINRDLVSSYRENEIANHPQTKNLSTAQHLCNTGSSETNPENRIPSPGLEHQLLNQ